MARGHRRHVRGSAHTGRAVVAWGVVGLGAGFGLLVGFGVPWPKALLGTIGLLVVLLIAYVLELSGLMRPTHTLSRVDLPEPFSPITPQRSPLRTVQLRFLKRTTPPPTPSSFSRDERLGFYRYLPRETRRGD